MNILITAGGTSEKIDDVRRITNMGTGRLGALVADAFVGWVPGCRIVYVCSEGAARPKAPADVQGAQGVGTGVDANQYLRPKASVEVRIADDVGAVEATIRSLCACIAFDIIVHSMAISDFSVRAVSDADLMTEEILERLAVLACGDSSSPEEAVRDVLLSPQGIREPKISSDKENLIVVLEKAPKIISLLRGLAPSAVIVGFKLLAGAGGEALVQSGLDLLKKNDCDFVLANDMNTARGDKHEGLLIDRDGSYEWAVGKEAIAAMIVRETLQALDDLHASRTGKR